MKTWFEVTITQKKRSRRSLIRKVAFIILCIWFTLLLLDRYQSYSLKGKSNSILHVAQLQQSIASQEIYQGYSAQEALTEKTLLQEKKDSLRQIRMHNTLRRISRRGNSTTGDSLSNTNKIENSILDLESVATMTTLKTRRLVLQWESRIN